MEFLDKLVLMVALARSEASRRAHARTASYFHEPGGRAMDWLMGVLIFVVVFAAVFGAVIISSLNTTAGDFNPTTGKYKSFPNAAAILAILGLVGLILIVVVVYSIWKGGTKGM